MIALESAAFDAAYTGEKSRPQAIRLRQTAIVTPLIAWQSSTV